MAQQQPFDPNEFVKWFFDGIKETVKYRLKQTFSRENIADVIRSKIPTRNQVVHRLLREAFEKNGFQFETLKMGDTSFQLIRKQYAKRNQSKTGSGKLRRLVLIPGFGDSPASWIPSFVFCKKELNSLFDEILIIDFPGYMGFLSDQSIVPSMAVLQSVVKTICEANPPTVLIGHSLGGWLAGKVAQELRRPLEHLIVVSPSGLIPELEREAFADVILNSKEVPVEELLEKVMHEPKAYFQFVSQEVKSFYARNSVKEFVESVKPDQFINPALPFVSRRVSVMWGDHDEYVPAHWLRYWVEHYGDVTDAYLLENTGHIPQLEHPKAMAEVLLNALRGGEVKSGKGWKRVHKRTRENPTGEFDLTHQVDPGTKLLT